MTFNRILILMLILLPQVVFGSNNWSVVGTIDVEGESHICLVTPISTGTIDIWVLVRSSNKKPMVRFGMDDHVTSFRYLIDKPNTPENVQEFLNPSKGNGAFLIHGNQATKFIQQLKKGNKITYLISSTKQ